ncbi:hypothetical protein BDV28DRAFT_3477 [Aspergillus coremiiformis]|uniref:Uncharacterized protein n=1 Tax=Aspergillus coremiiformis TaxID=138285 RepID=A0A5N6Z409_9EURO|nr:hypothetical protein BDV28DRAFT_3477 [Aspergillus coremiiformis]
MKPLVCWTSLLPLVSGTPLCCVSQPCPERQTVLVGGEQSNEVRGFNPHTLRVCQGSIVHFDFLRLDHTLRESTLETPCKPLQGGIDSGTDRSNPDNITNFKPFDYTFASDAPRFFYCAHGEGTNDSHCARGEVFAVNVNEDTFHQFQDRAKTTGHTSYPDSLSDDVAEVAWVHCVLSPLRPSFHDDM